MHSRAPAITPKAKDRDTENPGDDPGCGADDQSHHHLATDVVVPDRVHAGPQYPGLRRAEESGKSSSAEARNLQAPPLR